MTAWLYFLFTCLVATAFGEENDTRTVFKAYDFRSVNELISKHEYGLFFIDMDCNRDNIISTTEAVCKYREYGIGPELPAFISSADADADGFVTNEEYKAFFDAMDPDNNSRVSWDEFQTAWTEFQKRK